MIYLDFDLKIEAGSGSVYPVAVLDSPAGQAREVMRFPFDTVALENHLLKLQNALLRSGETRRKSLSPEEEAVQHFGRALFEALFVGEVGSLYRESVRMAKREGKGLRLKLRIAPPDLAALPWEFLNDPRSDYLCLSPDTPIVRYPELAHPGQEPLAVTLPLRILGMVASSHDQRALNVDEEKQRLETALAPLQARGLVELEWLPGQTWRELQAALRRGGWHIFHFIGHGGFDDSKDEGFLDFADDRGKTCRFYAGQLADMFNGQYTLRFVLLNACEGAKGSQHDLVSSTAAALVHRGLPGALAMQYDITDHAAIELSRAFYEALAAGKPVDFSVAEGRRAVRFADERSLEWGIPVLYLRAADGILFDLHPEPPIPPRDTQAENTPSPQPVVPPRSSSAHTVREAEIEVLYKKLLRAEAASRWDAVIEAGEQILKLNPSHQPTRTKTANAFNRRGIYNNQRDYERAIADKSRAIELDSARADFYWERGVSYAWKRDYERAIADYSRAIELDPTRPDFYASRGVSYYKQGDYERAIADYNRAIELDSTRPTFYFYRGLSYKLQGNRAAARKNFKQSAALGHGGAEVELG